MLNTIDPSLSNDSTTRALQISDPSATVPVEPPRASPSLETPSLHLTSPTAWNQVLALDPALSPHTSISVSASTRAISSLRRWHSLSSALRLRDSSISLERMANRCFALFFEYLYPLIPLVHEPSLRDGLDFFVSQATEINRPTQHADAATIPEVGTAFTPGDSSAERNILGEDYSLKYPELWSNSTFTLITAVCAEAAFLLPNDIFPERETIAEIFLHASRSCLSSYLEADLEYPNANSITIRYFHSNCLHAAGKPKFSWHIFGEATRLAQAMQLHDESSLKGLLPVEAELRRRAFWIVYIGDKSSAILNNRPITIHKFSFETGITTEYPTGIEDEMNISLGSEVLDAARTRLVAGFNANLRLWQAASDLILEIRLQQYQKDISLIGQHLTTEERGRLDSLYVRFVTCLDDLPPYLQTDAFAASLSEGNAQLKQYIIQRANLQVSLHCLRMVITQKFEDLEFFATGVEHTDMLLLRKTEIARDMLRVIREAPFWSLQVNGEPCVSIFNMIL